MRALCALLCMLWMTPALAQAPEKPDGPATAHPDEPGMEELVRKAASEEYWSRREEGPTMKFGYRTFAVSGVGGEDSWYHGVTLDYYFLSKFFRAGAGLEVSLDTSPRENFILGATLTAGAQFPYRVTPFVDFVLCLGVLRRDLLDQDIYSFTYHFGLDFGVDFFVHDQFLLSLALGWKHPVFRYAGNELVESADVFFDSFTLKLGLGF